MPYKYEYYSDDNEEKDRRQSKRRKLEHIHATKATCLEDEDQLALVDALEDEVQKEDVIKKIKAKYEKDIEKARSQLRESKRQTEQIRKAIRDGEGAEFDSLLSVGDSLSHILSFLDISSIGKCEETCKEMKKLAGPAWALYDKQIDQRYISPLGDTVRDRTLRFCLASEYARRAESEIEKHQMEGHEQVCGNREHIGKKPNECNYCGKMEANWQIEAKEEGYYEYDYSDGNEDIGDDDSCCFPDTLNQDAIRKPEAFDIFMRVTNRQSEILFEGFVPQEQLRTVTRKNGTVGLEINFRGMKFPNWPDMERSLSLHVEKDRKEWLKSTSTIPHITLLAMSKTSPTKIPSVNSLSSTLLGCFGYCDLTEMDEFDGEYDPEDGIITYYEGYGFVQDKYHIRVGSITAKHPHLEEHTAPCRYLYLLWGKEANGNFAGIRIEDGLMPVHYTRDWNRFYSSMY